MPNQPPEKYKQIAIPPVKRESVFILPKNGTSSEQNALDEFVFFLEEHEVKCSLDVIIPNPEDQTVKVTVNRF